MATIQQLTLEAFRWQNNSSLQELVSPFLGNFLRSSGRLNLTEFSENPILDFSGYLPFVSSPVDLSGIEILAPYCQSITYPVITDLTKITTPFIISHFTELRTLNQNVLAGAGSYQAWVGDFTGMKKLEKFEVTFTGAGTSAYKSKFPILSQNPNLQYFTISGGGVAELANVTALGNLSNNLALREYRLRYLQGGLISNTRPVIDNVLSTLRTAKQNGGAINRIDFEGSPAPTGGSSNADYLWLIANGVNVTLGTL